MAKKRKLDAKASAAASSNEPTEPAAEEETTVTAGDETITTAAGDDPALTTDEGSNAKDGEAIADEVLTEGVQDLPPSNTEGEASHGVDEAHTGEGEEDDNDPASIQELLDPLPKELLIELLRDAGVKHKDVLAEIHRIADADPVHRKIFVHGLGWDATAESLAAVFREYGEIEECKAVVDKATGKAKGYGFILFKHRSGARRALENPQKKLGNRMTSCQLASMGPVPPAPPPVSEYTQRKIFVSNVGAEVDPQRLLQFFAKFGEIEEGPLGLDKVTGKPKGFALFVYKSSESAKKALEEPHKKFEGHILHCQRAIDGPKPHKPGFQFQVGQQGGFHYGGSGTGVSASSFQRTDSAGFLGGVGNYTGGASTTGHLMAPSATGLGYNKVGQPATAGAATSIGLNPALGQALNALLSTQGTGLGLTNLMGSAGMAGQGANNGIAGSLANSVGHGIQGGYGNQVSSVAGSLNPGVIGGYGSSQAMHGAYGNMSMGQGGTGRNQQGHGHMSGLGPYKGR